MSYIRWLVAVVAIGCCGACKEYNRNHAHEGVQRSSIEKGEELATRYCQSCHALPDPSQLDANSWERGVLPHMGPLLGIRYFKGRRYPFAEGDRFLDKGYYPHSPLLNEEDWQHIVDYYTATSPDSLPGQQRKEGIGQGVSLFQVVSPGGGGPPPATCMVWIDTVGRRNSLLTGDVLTGSLRRWDEALRLVDSVGCGGPVLGVDRGKDGMVACNVGLLNPSNARLGKGQVIREDAGGKMRVDSLTLFAGLARPVQVSAVDLNGDGRMDYLVCEFGYMTGALSWMENRGDSGYLRHVIKALPGAIKAYIDDYNHDGRPDLWVLFAQGEEGIFLFTNKGGGAFSEEEVLRFPPMNGSSYFELADMNKDGRPDIVYTCGDNADFSMVLKPYHGVYIFLNDGTNHFRQDFFFPINGCYKAMARDFDGDGDLDLVTIAFFPDFKRQPEEGFVYLENKGNGVFKPYSIPGTGAGRWLTMDVGDLDGDGRMDIVLGNFSFLAPVTKAGVDFKKGPPFLVLRNVGRK